MRLQKMRHLALTWLLALGLSAILVAAGQRWPQPLPIQSAVVWGSLFLVPLLTLLVVLTRWPLPGEGEEGESFEP